MSQFPSPEQEISPLHGSIFSAARVAGIAAIVSLGGSLIGIISLLIKPAAPLPVAEEGFEGQDMQQLAQSSTYLSAFVSLIISVLVFYFLFRFASQARAGIKNGNPGQVSSGLQSLARYFKIWGIIALMVIILFALSLIGGIAGSLFGG